MRCDINKSLTGVVPKVAKEGQIIGGLYLLKYTLSNIKTIKANDIRFAF